MTQKNLDFRHISASLRPPRYALAYHEYDDWIFQARRANAVMARVWGGAGNILVPVKADPRTADPQLLPFLRLFDPDYVGCHLRTVGDLGGDPELRTKIINEHSYGGESPDRTWSRLRLERLSDEGNWDEFADQVDAWCSPYRGTRQVHTRFRPQNLDWPSRDGQSRRHLLTVPFHPGSRVVVFDLDDVDPFIGLMVESRIGAVDEVARDDEIVVRIPVEDRDLSKLITLAITGTSHGWDLADGYRIATGTEESVAVTPTMAGDLLVDSPYSYTRHWTTKISTGYGPPVVCVVGDQPEDHALAMMADRIFKHGAWVPRFLLDSQHSMTVKLAIDKLCRLPEDHDLSVLVTSVSEDLETIQELVAEINELFQLRSAPSGEIIRTGSSLHAVAPGDLLEAESRSWLADPMGFSIRRTLPVAVEGAEVMTLAPLQLPLPEAAQVVGVDMEWHTDVWLPHYQAPARTAIPSKSFLPARAGGFPDAVFRTGRTGLSFASPNMGFTSSSDPVDYRIAQPQLRFPTTDELFGDIAACSGARVERSDAGRRAQNAVDMWGSFDAIAKDLAGTTRKVLDAFLPRGGKKHGDYGIGYAIRSEGFTSLEDIISNLKIAADDARLLIDRLLLINVVKRGFVLNCARCRSEAFYRIEHVGPTFICQACEHISPLTRGRWYDSDPEPHIYYALDQVVRDLLNQHGYLPILAAAELGKDARSVLWASELSVITDDDSIELDLCLIVDGRIIVGEAKSNGVLKADHGTQEAAKRLVTAAQIMSADEIILATSRDRWSPGTSKNVEEAIDAHWRRGPKPKLRELLNVGSGSQ